MKNTVDEKLSTQNGPSCTLNTATACALHDKNGSYVTCFCHITSYLSLLRPYLRSQKSSSWEHDSMLEW